MSTAGRRWRRRGGAPYHMSLSFFCHTFSPGNHLPLFDCLSNSFLPHSHLASNYESRSLSFSCSAINLVTESFHLFPLIYVLYPAPLPQGFHRAVFYLVFVSLFLASLFHLIHFGIFFRLCSDVVCSRSQKCFQRTDLNVRSSVRGHIGPVPLHDLWKEHPACLSLVVVVFPL